jgi:hypothetical protein
MVVEHLKHYDDDRMVHHLRVGVVGMPHPLAADVESDFYQHPRVKELWRDGGINLPEPLREQFITACFDRLWPTLDGNDIGEVLLPDATSWIGAVFSTADTAVVLSELRRHVVPGLLAEIGRCTSFVPVTLPKKGEPRD